MRRILLIACLLPVFAGEQAEKPDYLKRKPETARAAKLPPPKVDPATPSSELPAVTEMKVESSTTGQRTQPGKPSKSKSAVHGDVRTSSAAGARAASGAAVVQDKKDGKWAVTVSGDTVKRKR
jgi:hypothetical protein